MLVTVIIFIWLERRLVGRFQMRYGPNRAGPFGLLQTISDVVKILNKEDNIPAKGDRLVFWLAPVVAFTPVLLVFAVVPFWDGALLADRAEPLAAAGLRRVNVSIDAMRPDHYAEVTRGGDVRLVLAGIDAARAADLAPIKLNCVVGESSDEPDAQDVAAFARENGFEVRFIHNMDLEKGEFSIVEGGSGGDCPRCNRLRLSSDGFIRPCLFSDLAFSVRELGPAGALSKAVRRKPRAGGPCTHNWMYGIGG